jgi:hypothetical protein
VQHASIHPTALLNNAKGMVDMSSLSAAVHLFLPTCRVPHCWWLPLPGPSQRAACHQEARTTAPSATTHHTLPQWLLLRVHSVGWQPLLLAPLRRVESHLKMTTAPSATTPHTLLQWLLLHVHSAGWQPLLLAPLRRGESYLKKKTETSLPTSHTLLLLQGHATGLHRQQKQGAAAHSKFALRLRRIFSANWHARGSSWRLSQPAARCPCSSTAAMQRSAPSLVSTQTAVAQQALALAGLAECLAPAAAQVLQVILVAARTALPHSSLPC